MTLVDSGRSKSASPARSVDDRAARSRKSRARWRDRWPAIAAAIGLIVLWQLIIVVFGIREFIVPSPFVVAEVFVTKPDVLWNNFWPTFFEALAGFVVGNSVAVLLAIWFVHSRASEKAFYPIAVFINTIPIIAIAPILNLLFGYGFEPKVIIAALICFFPTLVNMVRGLKSVSLQMVELMRVLSASPREVLFKVRLQASMPYLFASLKIASTSCVVGAIVGEWVGSNYGLGWLILDATHNYRMPTLYATVILGSGLAVVFFSLTSLAERWLLKWRPSTAF